MSSFITTLVKETTVFNMKPKNRVHNHFDETLVNGKSFFKCTFCHKGYTYRNATKFARHLANKCDKGPENVKNNFKNDKVNEINAAGTSQQPLMNLTTNTSSAPVPILEGSCNEIHRAFARAIYVSGASLSLLEHPLWKEVLHKLNPEYTVPSRKLLSTTLLENEYANVQDTIQQAVNESSVLHLAVDGWTNVRNDAILNVMLYTPKPYFYKFIATEDDSHTAEYLTEKVSEIFDRIGAEKFLAIVSDNAANMAKCGNLLQRKYNHIIWVGCLAHTFHLWIGDILKTDKVRDLFSHVVDVIKTIRHSHVLSARFKKIAKENNIHNSLSVPVKTRWGSYLFSLESFIKCKFVLQNMAINEENRKLAPFKVRLLDESIWNELEELKEFLKPTVNWILKLEGDYCIVHLVYQAIREMEDLLSNPLTHELLKEDFEEVKIKFVGRKRNALKPVHFAACILDPNNQGTNLTSEEHLQGCEFIINSIEASNNNNAQQVLLEITNYKNRTDIFQKGFVWEMSKTTEPIIWWKSLYPQTILGKIAAKILSVPATSASVERSFSTFSNIHSNKRNRLTTDRAGKICYISHNWKLFNKKNTSSSVNPDNGLNESSSDLKYDDETGSEDDFPDVVRTQFAIEEEQNIESIVGLEDDPLG